MSAAASVQEGLQGIGGEASLPAAFYWLSLFLLVLLFAIPTVYRWTWLFIYDVISGVRLDLAPSKAVPGCRRIGNKPTRNLSGHSFPTVHNGSTKHPDFPSLSPEDLEKLSPHSPDSAAVCTSGRIEALCIHPLKSTAPIEVESAVLTSLGFAHDRIFCLAQLESKLPDLDGKTDHTWVFLSQRDVPRLALVTTEIWLPDPEADGYDEGNEWVQNGGCLVVRFPFEEDIEWNRNGLRNIITNLILRLRPKDAVRGTQLEFRLPLEPSEQRVKEKNYPHASMRLHQDILEAWDVSCEVEREILLKFRYTLGISNPITIFRTPKDSARMLYKCAPTVDQLGYQTKLCMQDAYPISIQNLNSIDRIEKSAAEMAALKGKSYRPDTRRFRSNIYASGITAFAELHLKRMAIQSSQSACNKEPAEPLFVSLPCRIPRCKVTNTDPKLGERDRVNQPLGHINSQWNVDKGTPNGVLGMMVVPMHKSIGAEIRVGDELILYDYGEHVFNRNGQEDKRTPNF